jgi:hypothetical protein
MTYWVLTKSGTVIARSNVQHLMAADMATDTMKTCLQTFDANLLTRLEDENFQIDLPSHVFYLQDEDGLDPDGDAPDIPTASEYGDMLQEPKEMLRTQNLKCLTNIYQY